jgi:hypothetical protein
MASLTLTLFGERHTRRSALTTGTLFLGAGLLAVTAAPDIDRAEALLLEIRDIILRLDERHAGDVGHVLNLMGRAAGLAEPGFSEVLAKIDEHVGPGNRVMDRIDRAA